MISRRDLMKLGATAGAAVALKPSILQALAPQEMIMRAIPSSGEEVPVVGLGSSATFSRVARGEDFTALREVLGAFAEHGGRVFDTAPSYGASEEVAGQIADELGIGDQVFWATKLNVAGRGGGPADPDEARAQLHQSFQRLRREKIDLIQVHNLGDPPTQLGILKELKSEGHIRYMGITTTSEGRYEDLAEIMKSEPLDFIGIDYAVDNRSAEEIILPLAQEEGIGVLVYVPFGRSRLFSRVGDRELPDWAEPFADTWAQFFIKFAAAHPAVTTVTPATSQAKHMIDNLGAAHGRLPNPDEIKKMVELVEGLPPAPRRG
ncbi:MAG: aldo/keto reductase [Gemmatimonadetes bacterium]|nr:aldo/keto reductase [Gemmatimonadota bacterium]